MSQSSSHVQQLDSLSGLITADNIVAASSTSDQNGNLQVSAAGSAFTNLVVAGQKSRVRQPLTQRSIFRGLAT